MKKIYFKDLCGYFEQEITIEGIVESVRNLQYVVFVVVRDITGKVQVTIEKEGNDELVESVSNLTSDSTVNIKGILKKNEKVKLNGMELIPSNIVVTHATCLAAMLSRWCSVSYGGSYKFLNKEFFDGNWDYLETFKLEFDNDKLISIKNINIDK